MPSATPAEAWTASCRSSYPGAPVPGGLNEGLHRGASSAPPRPWRSMSADSLAPRLARLPRVRALGIDVAVAATPRSRLLGLALLARGQIGGGLLIPRCSSVHTFGMRFALDLVFLDARGRPLALHRRVRAGRIVSHRGATAVLELPSGSRDQRSM